MVVEKSYEYAKKAQDLCKKNDHIEPNLYDEYGVNLGLRDLNGNGVLTGLTNISKIISSEIVDYILRDCRWKKGSGRRKAVVPGLPSRTAD